MLRNVCLNSHFFCDEFGWCRLDISYQTHSVNNSIMQWNARLHELENIWSRIGTEPRLMNVDTMINYVNTSESTAIVLLSDL